MSPSSEKGKRSVGFCLFVCLFNLVKGKKLGWMIAVKNEILRKGRRRRGKEDLTTSLSVLYGMVFPPRNVLNK